MYHNIRVIQKKPFLDVLFFKCLLRDLTCIVDDHPRGGHKFTIGNSSIINRLDIVREAYFETIASWCRRCRCSHEGVAQMSDYEQLTQSCAKCVTHHYNPDESCDGSISYITRNGYNYFVSVGVYDWYCYFCESNEQDDEEDRDHNDICHCGYCGYHIESEPDYEDMIPERTHVDLLFTPKKQPHWRTRFNRRRHSRRNSIKK